MAEGTWTGSQAAYTQVAPLGKEAGAGRPAEEGSLAVEAGTRPVAEVGKREDSPCWDNQPSLHLFLPEEGYVMFM